MANNRKNFSVSLDEDTLYEVERVRFEQRFSNRSLAIDYLIQLGIQVLKDNPELANNAIKQGTRVRKHSEASE